MANEHVFRLHFSDRTQVAHTVWPGCFGPLGNKSPDFNRLSLIPFWLLQDCYTEVKYHWKSLFRSLGVWEFDCYIEGPLYPMTLYRDPTVPKYMPSYPHPKTHKKARYFFLANNNIFGSAHVLCFYRITRFECLLRLHSDSERLEIVT